MNFSEKWSKFNNRLQVHQELAKDEKTERPKHYPTEDEINTIKALVDALEIVEAGTRALCSRDTDLAVADQIFEYTITELRKLHTTISYRLEIALENRISERRLKVESTLLGYLKNPKFLHDGEKVLTYANKSEITKLARDLYIRLFLKDSPIHDEQSEPQVGSIDEEQNEGPTPPKKSRSNELWALLDKSRQKSEVNCGKTTTKTPASVLNDIKKEMQLFEARGQRPGMLAALYRAMLTIPATSCEAEVK